MSGDGDRQQRNIDLMKKSFLALEAEQKNDDSSALFEREAVGRRAEDRDGQDGTADDVSDDDGDVVKYRGRPIRRSSAGTPGAGSGQGKTTRFRGAGGNQRRRSSDQAKGAKGVSIDKIKEALTSLSEMYEEGLITKTEFDAKRRQLLDRL